MEKAIYGLAMPFNDSVWEYDLLSNTYTFRSTNRESVELDNIVGATIRHDYSKQIGRTDEDSLIIHMNEKGLFFKVIPKTPIALKTYKKVRHGHIRHCSVSFIHKPERNFQKEKKLEELKKIMGWKERVVVYESKEILVYEVCICEYPRNERTWCTTNKNDPRLAGIQWESDSK